MRGQRKAASQEAIRFVPLMTRLKSVGHSREPVPAFRHENCQRLGQCLREFLMIRNNWNAAGAECPRECKSLMPEESWLKAERFADGRRESSLAPAEQWALDHGNLGSGESDEEDEITAAEIDGSMAEDGR